jgi:glycine oxidase
MLVNNQDKEFDAIIVGAGVLGLWAARQIICEGGSVCVLDRQRVGSGASGGILGALMSHIPDGWNIKKEFQFQALDMLEGKLEKLSKDSGLGTGYRRCGRVMPLIHEGMKGHVESWLSGAEINWRGRYNMEYLEFENSWFLDTGWPLSANAPFGASFDTFAARCNPRKVIAALAAFVRLHGEIREGCLVSSILPDQNKVILCDGTEINGREIIVANGVDAYRLLHPFMGPANDDKPLGRGVRGQAVMIEFAHDDTLPILYQDGTYIVPHENNQMAIGSTSHSILLSELEEVHAQFDPADMDFYQRAVKLAPKIKDAPIVEHWAGIRPRNTLKGRGADPWFEKVPGHDNLIALIGGFKITFGIAHRAMDVARGRIEGPRRQKLSWVQ